MAPTDLLKPIGVFVLIIVVILGGTATLSTAMTGSDAQTNTTTTPDGKNINGQSPKSFKPSNVKVTSDPEKGNIKVGGGEPTRILIDTRHGNEYGAEAIERIETALARQGHRVNVTGATGESSFGETNYNETLRAFDAILIIAPTVKFTDKQVRGLKSFAESGGRVVVLSEPTQSSISGSGFFASATVKQYTGSAFTQEFGMRMGPQVLYNQADNRNDNNFKSIHAKTVGSGPLRRGYSDVTFDTAGSIVLSKNSDAEPILQAANGTKGLERRQTGSYTVAARNGNVVLVSDSSFIQPSEVYDLGNEKFLGNLLTFLLNADKPDDVPPTPTTTDSGFGDDFDDNDGGGDKSTPTAPETVGGTVTGG